MVSKTGLASTTANKNKECSYKLKIYRVTNKINHSTQSISMKLLTVIHNQHPDTL